MFKIGFEVDAEEYPLSGFEMGNLVIKSNETSIDSRLKRSRHMMMLFLSLVELLNGVRNFLESNKSMYEFVGVDSSFILLLEKTSKRGVRLNFEKTFIAISEKELINELFISSFKFWKAKKPYLEKADPVIEDMECAIKTFEEFRKNR